MAGVSVGSLYQYYPSKEALVAAVIDRHNQEIMRVVRGALAEVASQPIEKAVRRLVNVAIEAHRIDPKLHRVLAEQIPRTGRLENVESFNRETYALFRAYLEGHSDELRFIDLDLAAFVCVTSIEALAHTAVVHRSEKMSGEAVQVRRTSEARDFSFTCRPRRAEGLPVTIRKPWRDNYGREAYAFKWLSDGRPRTNTSRRRAQRAAAFSNAASAGAPIET